MTARRDKQFRSAERLYRLHPTAARFAAQWPYQKRKTDVPKQARPLNACNDYFLPGDLSAFGALGGRFFSSCFSPSRGSVVSTKPGRFRGSGLPQPGAKLAQASRAMSSKR
jgi:hypothetical protein